MDHATVAGLDGEYIMHTYGRCDLVASEGCGATLTDADGRKFIDFTAGIGVNSLGWQDEKWLEAVERQLHSFQHISNYFISPVTALLAKRLVGLSGLSKVFFGNSGAEANEGAIKIARKYSFDKYGDGRGTVITLKRSFHGRTITTLAATGQESFHKYFGPFTQGFKYAEMNDAAALEEAATDDVCAIMAEPVQGEGGINVMDRDYAAALRRICDERDLILIFDEVQCGIGRTGELFAYEAFGYKPDVVTLAKGLAGGLPIGAVIAGQKCADTLGAGMHGSTFGGNPVSAAGANAVLDRLTSDGFLASVKRKGDYIRNRITEAAFPAVKELRGRGLMIGIAVQGGITPKNYLHKAFDNGLLVLTAGDDAIRLLPPLTISDSELEKGCDILVNILK